MNSGPVSHDEAKEYYEDFALTVGQRDWLAPNLRHEQLKLQMNRLLGKRSGLRIGDVGCGAGVLSSHLTKWGDVTAVDFSTAAIESAKRYDRRPTYRPGGLEALPGTYDLLTLFDVLEHIPEADRPGFIAELAGKLAPGGLLFVSTPYPTATARRKGFSDDSLQIIDEEVELADVAAEASAAGLQIVRYEAYDIFAGSPEYQAFLFTLKLTPGGPPALRPAALERRSRLITNYWFTSARRVRLAARCLRHGDVKTAWWFLRGTPPHIES